MCKTAFRACILSSHVPFQAPFYRGFVADPGCVGAHQRDQRRESSGFRGYSPWRAAAAMWSLLKADVYAAGADYVALSDADVVFWTPLMPELLFEWSQARPRPRGACLPGFI